ncbi:hypothetical protein [Streptococcus massiliensis]|uniref:Phosphoribosylaminoimidazolecarboxamide formyltransferase n=1 Tax=Streptococcus massiliensis TaxID=313439 RepID=A0A380KZI9_9STRE|nr:hypothetical protein [Streptococcus massiliensis]SUN76356.1 Uncharacterised protein [Streptococcus massiliensis]
MIKKVLLSIVIFVIGAFIFNALLGSLENPWRLILAYLFGMIACAVVDWLIFYKRK